MKCAACSESVAQKVLIWSLFQECSIDRGGGSLLCCKWTLGMPKLKPLPRNSVQTLANKSFCTCHDVQFSCAINQPLLAHHWRVHQCFFTSRFIAPSIPWGVSAPGGKMLKRLLKDHNVLNNSPIFIIESSTLRYLLFKKHCIQYISIWNVVLDMVKGTWQHNFMAGCGSLLWANTCSLWSGIKSWPGAGCLQRLVRCSCQ